MELRLLFSEGDSKFFTLFAVQLNLLSKDHWDTQSAICCALLAPPLASQTSDVVVLWTSPAGL